MPEITAPWTAWPLGRGVQGVAHDDRGLVALDKPCGVLSHPNAARDRSRALLVADYSKQDECFAFRDAAGLARRAWLLHRLDSATSGVILLATDEALARRTRAAFEGHAVAKLYLAIVFGRAAGLDADWRDRLTVDKSGGQVRTRTGGAVEAIAHARCVAHIAHGEHPRALLELAPRTGRSHQLRVQCAHRRLPIVGDQTYGDFKRNRSFAKATGHKRLFLHAARISLDLEGRRFEAEASAPEAFTTAMAE